MSDEQIDACPACDSHDIYHRTPALAEFPDTEHEYHCMNCKHEFDTPEQREKQYPGKVPSHSLAAKLADDDVTSVDDLTEADP